MVRIRDMVTTLRGNEWDGLPGLARKCRPTAPKGRRWVAQGEPYSANPGNGDFFFFSSSCLTPRAEVAHAGLYGFEQRSQGNMHVARCHLPMTVRPRPVASGTMKNVNQHMARVRGVPLTLGYPRRPVGAACWRSIARPERPLCSSPCNDTTTFEFTTYA